MRKDDAICGVAGIVGPGAENQGLALRRMLEALQHRGPDEEGVWRGRSAVLGTQRLAIIDPAGGHQPIVSDDGNTVVVANGEIYGHRRLRERYADYPFRSGSDIEVIVPLHADHGPNFLEQLPGTFALALWDARTLELTLARDRFGERPLYWAQVGELVVFASEPQALRASGLVDVEVDRGVLARMLRQGYVPPGDCIWRGMSSLAHASVLRCTVGGAGPLVSRWWYPPTVEPPSGGVADPVEWFRGALDRAVQDQLVADAPVGTFLSGGLDSSTVSALAARHHPRISGFAFDMPGESELPFARAVAQRHGIDLHVFRPSTDDLVGALHEAAATWGEPLGDSSTLPTLMLSRFVRDSVKVALTGDGADELLGGYLTWSRGMLEADDPAGTGGTVAPQRRWPTLFRSGRRRRRNTSVARRYADFRSYFTPEELGAFGLPPASADQVSVDSYGYGTADDISRFDLDHYLPGDILVKTDRASMAVGLEVRAPFLDVEVAEGCLRLPAHWKVDSSSEKLLLRQAFGHLLPTEVVARPKQGFGSPMARWLAEPGVDELVRAELGDAGAPVFDLLNFDAVGAFLGAPDQRLWSLLTVALWWRIHG